MIGITGGIGSGKSTIANELRRRGYTVYDTDIEAKRLMVEDSQLRQQIIALLGEQVYEGNTYRRDLVAAQVFQHPDLLQRLNKLVHPAVAKDIQSRPNMDFVESAILFESGLDQLCTTVIAVVAPESIRLQRAIRRDQSNEQKIRERMAAQMSDEALRQQCQHIVVNDGTHTIPELVTQLLQEL